MAKAARQLDVIDTAPPFTPADAARLNEHYDGVDTAQMLADLLATRPFENIAAVSSFGAESAVLLHMIAQIDKSVPLIFVNTQKMFGETLLYVDELSERLGFTDLRVYRPDPLLLAQRDATGLRWSYDPDGCCDLRKSEPLRRALFGDLHVHTAVSMDAWLEGTLATPDDAYRFAKGEPVIHPYHRARVQLETPLDFLAVTDHAELLGAPYSLFELNDKRLAQTRLGRRLRELMQAGRPEDAFGLFILAINSAGTPAENRPRRIDWMTALSWRFQDLVRPSDARARATRWLMSDPSLVAELDNPELQATLWARNMDAAERHNAPGKFTTLVGWEYSPTPEGANLHRIVLSDADPLAAKSLRPFSANDSGNPEDLWSWLDETSKSTSSGFMSIPPNSNISKGKMFANVDSTGRAFTPEYARQRAHWESIVEVTQIKGTSETHPLLSPDDEFASFEFFSRLIESRLGAQTKPTTEVADYARSALKLGLEIEGADHRAHRARLAGDRPVARLRASAGVDGSGRRVRAGQHPRRRRIRRGVASSRHQEKQAKHHRRLYCRRRVAYRQPLHLARKTCY